MKLILTVLFILSKQLIYSQNGNWDVYLAQWDNKPGSVALNMDLIETSPKRNLPFIIITGVTFTKCTSDGFPEKEEFDNLYPISDSLNHIISKLTKSELVGTFTYQCERLDYIYVEDTIGIRANLNKLYSTKFKEYKSYINIRDDHEWQAYREFLYPNEETREAMSNQKVIENLVKDGDDLSKSRQVDHWIYFNLEKDRDAFISYIEKDNFHVENSNLVSANPLPFQLQISRKDHVDLKSISIVTLELRKAAKLYKGEYDGWETFVIRQ